MVEFVKQQLGEQKQNHHNEFEPLKKEVSELEKNIEILSEKKRKHTTTLSFPSVRLPLINCVICYDVHEGLNSPFRVNYSLVILQLLESDTDSLPPISHLPISLSKKMLICTVQNCCIFIFIFICFVLKSYWKLQYYTEDENRNKHFCNIK